MQLNHLVLAFTTIICWGLNFVFIKLALDGFAPVFLCCLRFFLTSIPAIFFVKKPKDVPFKMVALYGVAMFALQFSLLFGAIDLGVPPGLASILAQLQAFFTIFFAIVFLREKLNRWQALGAFIAFCGIVIVARNLGQEVSMVGFLLAIGAAASWGAGNIITKKISTTNAFSLVIWGSLFAWPPLLLLSLATEGAHGIYTTLQQVDWLPVGAVIFIAYISTIFGFGVWNMLLRYYPLTRVAPYGLLVPVVAMISSSIVFNEPLPSWKIFAMTFILLGLCINLFGARLLARVAVSRRKPVS